MTYTTPLNEILFIINDVCELNIINQFPQFEHLDDETVSAILGEAAKYTDNILSPLNRVGDQQGSTFENGQVTTPDGWKTSYDQMVDLGLNAPSASQEYGGLGLPNLINAAITEMFQGANVSFQLCPMLTQGAVETLDQFASEQQKQTYLPNLISGTWSGTMNLTEPQAGSDLAQIRTTATPQHDHYLIKGQKIFITYGEHDLTENIIHLVLARLPDAPEGVKGISMFLVPKFLINEGETLGERNDVNCISVEHKLGIHASPTCTLSFGDEGKAVGYLVGEPNKGIDYMFAMMNNARLDVGIQGIAISEHAFQDALAYAQNRRQGGGKFIIEHQDIQRMLSTMRATIDAGRILAFKAAAATDVINCSTDENLIEQHKQRLDLLIPIIKGHWTEQAVELTSLGMQIHGGMGYMEETGVAQHFRDARITPIYEGTTGIQALDLVGRKILRDNGKAVGELVADMKATAEKVKNLFDDSGDWDLLYTSVDEAAELIKLSSQELITTSKVNKSQALGCANDVLKLFGYSLSVWALTIAALKARETETKDLEQSFVHKKIKTAKFFAVQQFPLARAAAQSISSKLAGGFELTPDELSSMH